MLLSTKRHCLQAIPYKDRIPTVGLSSTELGNPNIAYKDVYAAAVDAGFIPVAHAGVLAALLALVEAQLRVLADRLLPQH